MSARILLLFLLIPLSGFSQKVTFSEKVDAGGHATGISDRFSISRKGGFIKILVNGNKKLNSKFVVFDVYSVHDGKEVFENSIRLDINPYNNWFYKELTFYKEGNFIVYIYDERDQLVGVGKVLLMFKD